MNDAPQKKSPFIIRLLKGMFILLLLLVGAFFLIGMFVLDGKYEVSRSTTIKATPAAIHAQVGDLREWPNWLPFTKHDKSAKTTIEQPTGVGAAQSWTSDSGPGKLKFTASDENKGIEYDMLFNNKWAAKGSMSYEKSGDDTKVTWRMSGTNDDLMGRWFAVVMGPMMTPMFDEGLADLKKKVEPK